MFPDFSSLIAYVAFCSASCRELMAIVIWFASIWSETGAGYENRTRFSTLGRWHTTGVLIPHFTRWAGFSMHFINDFYSGNTRTFPACIRSGFTNAFVLAISTHLYPLLYMADAMDHRLSPVTTV